MSLVSCTIVDWRMLLLASSSPPLPSSRTQVSMESLAWLRSPFWGESPAHYLHRALFVFPLFPLTVLSLRNLSSWLWDLWLRMIKDEESFWDSQETTSSSIYANDGRDRLLSSEGILCGGRGLETLQFIAVSEAKEGDEEVRKVTLRRMDQGEGQRS